MMPREQSVHERFLAKIVTPSVDECWIWQACTGTNGYGLFRVDGRMFKAHRFAYELFVGPIPDGLELDHLCRVRTCVNPEHLDPVTHAENVRRGESGKVNGARQRAKTHCPQGHPYAGENLYVNSDGKRRCRTCNRDRGRKRAQRARDRAQAAA